MFLKKLIFSAIVVAFFSLFFLVKTPVYAATITVDTTIDEAATTDGNCTLREAITAANTDAIVDNCSAGSGTDTINIPATPITPITLVSALPTITTSMTLSGAGMTSTVIDADGTNTTSRIFTISGFALTIGIQNMTLQNGRIAGNGGAISTNAITTLTSVKVINNRATGGSAGGGGIYTSHSMTLTNVTISGNTSGGYGGGLYNTTTVVATNLTVSGNTASGQDGGGIYNEDSLALTNATIANNTAGNKGGGIFTGAFTLSSNIWTNVTIANNNAFSTTNGDGAWLGFATTELYHVLFSSNTGSNCSGNLSSVVSVGYNMSSDSTCSVALNQTGDQNSVSTINLDVLADNGGSVQTMALLSGSAAIDAGANTAGGLTCPSTDERGTSRPQDGDNDGTATCDIGAYEYVYVAPSPTATPVPSSGGSTSSPLAPLSTNTTDTPVCGDAKPQGVPEVFQINTTSKSATIYFTPVQNSTSYYYVSYGYTPGDQRFGVQFDGSHEGVQHYTINALSPNTTYYFQIRAGNGCMPGDFSNSLRAKTSRTLLQKLIFYLHGGK